MKVPPLAAGASLALGISICAASANATILVATYTGTVGSGYDKTGLFGVPGSSLNGDPYVAKYIIDTGKGIYMPYTYEDQLHGGAFYGLSAPVSASLTINGRTQYVGGSDLSYATGFPTGFADRAEDDYYKDGVETSNYIFNQELFVGGSVLGTVPLTAGYIGISDTGNPDFGFNTYEYETSGPCQLALICTYGYLAGRGTFEVSAVSGAPEPATWAMILVGIGGMGAAMRGSRRKRSGAVTAV